MPPSAAPSSRLPTAAPAHRPVLQFDRQGNLLARWGGPGQGYEWPESNHGIFVDHKGAVWIGGNGGGDSHVLKFTQDGKFLAQFGKQNARRVAGTEAKPQYQRGSNDPNSFGRVAKIFVEPKANEAYLSDGYFNTRVAVLDADTRQDEALLGRLRQQAGRRGHGPLQT